MVSYVPGIFYYKRPLKVKVVIDVSLMSILDILAKRLQKWNYFMLKILTCPKWHELSFGSDAFSVGLKQASLLYATSFNFISLDILLDLQHKLRHQISICRCVSVIPDLGQLEDGLIGLNVSSAEELLQYHLIPCVIYLPAERDLTPPPLYYEKLSLDGGETWRGGAAIDGKMLLYFLLYLNHTHFGMEANAKADVANINWLLETDFCLGHRETAYNILGWIYKSKGLVD